MQRNYSPEIKNLIQEAVAPEDIEPCTFRDFMKEVMTTDMKANYKPKYERIAHTSGLFDIEAVGAERQK